MFDFKNRESGETDEIDGYKIIFWSYGNFELGGEAMQWDSEFDLKESLAIPIEERLPDDFYLNLKDGEFLIFINTDYWNRVFYGTREFILFHELGHVVNKHPEKGEKFALEKGWSKEETRLQIYKPGGFGWEYEREANVYALERLGWTKKMLEEFILDSFDPDTQDELLKDF